MHVSIIVFRIFNSYNNTQYSAVLNIFNPLSANVLYSGYDIAVTLDGCYSGHSENYENSLTLQHLSFG